ncbi:MAG: flagellar biosynthesis protein FlhB [Burkholderiaceae bacterium]
MSEDSDMEKTEPASQRRLEKAREDGDVPRSRELATCMLLITAGFIFLFAGDGLMYSLHDILVSGLGFDRAQAFDTDILLIHIRTNAIKVMATFLPFGVILMVVAIATPTLIGGWLFSAKALQPNFGRMNPIKGLTNMVSIKALVELVKAVGKTLLVGIVAWVVIWREKDEVLALALEPIRTSGAHLGSILSISFIAIACALILIVLIDVPYQIWQYAKKLKMTRQEVIKESKESDGNPQIKAKIRAQQREMARRRMMSEVPNADVIVTNPTHFAVALKYTESGMGAPKVVAKGAGAVAAKIRELASENSVPLLAAPALARALYKHAELGDEIPEALYTAVAEVLAYVFQLRTYHRQGGVFPTAPGNLDVPPELDPNNAMI